MNNAEAKNSEVYIFEYPTLFKLLYRYGNIPVTIILSIYLILSLVNLEKNLFFLIPITIILLLIYFLNKHYLMLYKITPYHIEADGEKLTCTDFLFQRKEVIIYYKDVESFTGGLLSGRMNSIMKLCDGKSKLCIGFYDKLKDVNKLQTLILSRVSKEVYDAVAKKLELKKKK